MIRLDADDNPDAMSDPPDEDPGDPGPVPPDEDGVTVARRALGPVRAKPRATVLLWAVYVDRRISAIVDSYQEARDLRDASPGAFIDIVDDTASVGDARDHRPPARGEPATERPSVRFTRATMEAIERRRGKRSVSAYLADLVERDS